MRKAWKVSVHRCHGRDQHLQYLNIFLPARIAPDSGLAVNRILFAPFPVLATVGGDKDEMGVNPRYDTCGLAGHEHQIASDTCFSP